MLHNEILQLLLPVPWVMTDNELTVYGAALDRVRSRLDAVLPEMTPDTAVELLAEWEALYQINITAGADLASRQQAVTSAYRATGDIKKPYFIALAAAHGYVIRINDYTESQSDWYCCGDELLEEGFIPFTAGVGSAGDTLAYLDEYLNWIWEIVVVSAPAVEPAPNLEQLLGDLKSPDMFLTFTYL